MNGKFFSNQNSDQIIKHLSNMLESGLYYNMSVDPLGVSFNIRESVHRPRPKEKKEEEVKKPGKIRTRKKGRTVNLKGRVY